MSVKGGMGCFKQPDPFEKLWDELLNGLALLSFDIQQLAEGLLRFIDYLQCLIFFQITVQFELLLRQ